MRSDPRAPRALLAREAQGRLLSIDEAVELAGVPHMHLQEHLRTGRLTVLQGRRRGRLLRLVRVGDLIRLYPRAALALLPAPGASNEELEDGVLPEAGDPLGEQLEASPDRRPAGGQVLGGIAHAQDSPAEPDPRHAPDPAQHQREVYLEAQLSLLREQMQRGRERNERLRRELLDSGKSVRTLLGSALGVEAFRGQQPGAAAHRMPGDSDAHAADKARALRRSRLLAALGWGVLALVLLREGWSVDERAQAAVVPSAALAQDAGGALTPGAATPGAAASAGLLDHARSTAYAAGGHPSPPGGADSAPVSTVPGQAPASAQSATEPPPAEDGRVRAASPREASVLAGEATGHSAGRPREPGSDAHVPHVREAVAHGLSVISGISLVHASAAAAPAAREAPPGLDASLPEEALARRAEVGARVGDVPCAYYPMTRPGGELRQVLGPCMGRWNPLLEAVVATHLGGRQACCRHHQFFVRTLAGSLARAREQARFARREGLPSPLLRLRIDRAASEFLRAELPVWIESGFESGLLEAGHRVRAEARPDTWQVDSWVRYADLSGGVQLRGFRLRLRVGDGPDGDALLAFEWRPAEVQHVR